MIDQVPMDRFVRELEELARRGFPSAEVHGYLAGSLIEPSTLDRYVTYRPDRYTRNLVHRSEEFELLVICWNVGQRAPIHGHEGERCWARVERGKLRFSNYREVSARPLVLEPVGEATDGSVGHLDGPADIHAVENLASFGERAITLHLYSRPYAECDIYDLAKGQKKRVRLDYDTKYGRPVERSAASPKE